MVDTLTEFHCKKSAYFTKIQQPVNRRYSLNSCFTEEDCFPISISALPRACSSYTELNSADRHVNYSTISRQDDSGMAFKWYRFTGAAGSVMPETCPPTGSCSAEYPGWLNGNHPTVAEGEVTRMVCFHSGASCCSLNNSIKVLNCNKYFVYQLTPLRYLQRYCGTNTRKC